MNIENEEQISMLEKQIAKQTENKKCYEELLKDMEKKEILEAMIELLRHIRNYEKYVATLTSYQTKGHLFYIKSDLEHKAIIKEMTLNRLIDRYNRLSNEIYLRQIPNTKN